ncbi:unnamed protein product, partial [Mesorhabditis belari]|uniref:Uncharacterized protein n=1 Tax=Mesorhabditis belari TaxID=2138241 RepID=A0AAF3ERB3_9BILA
MSDGDQRTTWDDKKQRIYLRICDYETKEFSGLTTYHGLVRIYNSNTWPSRIFWCVVVLSCLFLFMIHSGFLLLNYHSKPTLFQVNVIVPEEGLLFPDITICNNKPVFAEKLKAWKMPSDVLQYVLKAYSKDMESDLKILTSEQAEFVKYTNDYRNATKKVFSFMEFFSSVGADCHSMVEWCAFGGVPLDECCQQTQPILTDSGLCVRFPNSKFQHRQWFSGWAHGWQIMLKIDANEENESNFLPDEFADEGVRVAVHEANEFPSMRAHSVSVPPGTTLYTGIDVRNVTLLARHDWGLCQPDWDPAIHGDLVIPFGYSSRHCEANCLMKRYLEICECVPLAVTLADQFPICTPLQLAQCQKIINSKKKLNSSFYLNFSDSQTCFCDVKCEQLQYDLKTSYGNLRASDSRVSLDDDNGKFSRILVNVYMREISYERHEQQKQMQTADLLSNIAGSMGLFLGMSTVTLLEIFIYLFKSVWGTINSDRQKQFVEAMIMEENELQSEQQVIVVEEEQNEPLMSSDQMPLLHERKASRRISIVPISAYNTGSIGQRKASLMPEYLAEDRPPKRSISACAPLLGSRRVSLASNHDRRRASHQDSVVTTIGIPSSSTAWSSFSAEEPNRINVFHTRRHSAVPNKKRGSFLDF